MPFLRVDRDLAPRVGAAGVLPCVGRPGVVAELARTRNGVERPDQPACDHVVGAQVAGRRSVAFAGVGSDNDQVFEDAAGTLVRPGQPSRLASPHVDEPVLAERLDERAVGGVDRAEAAAGIEQQPPIGSIGALPVGETALGGLLGRRPHRLPGRRVERDDDALRAGDVHHAVDDDRVEGQARGVAGHRIEPDPLEPADVGPVDLGERGILHGVGRAAVVPPRRVGRRDRPRRGALAGRDHRNEPDRGRRGDPPESRSDRPDHRVLLTGGLRPPARASVRVAVARSATLAEARWAERRLVTVKGVYFTAKVQLYQQPPKNTPPGGCTCFHTTPAVRDEREAT